MTKLPLPQSITTAAANLPKAKWAKGSYIHDANGKRYIDGSSGPAVYCIGRLLEAVASYHAGLFTPLYAHSSRPSL